MVGCSKDNGRLEVRGVVTLDGHPLLRGSINFRPAPGNHAPSSGCTIDQGEFTLPAAHGLKPGKYLVTIQAFRKTGKMIDDPQMGKIDDIAPIEFQEPMPLEATVSVESANRFEFSLTTHRHTLRQTRRHPPDHARVHIILPCATICMRDAT